MPLIPNSLRDSMMTAFREAICEKMEIVPFVHQRKWWAASDGLELLDIPDPAGQSVRLPSGDTTRYMTVPRLEGRARFIADLGAFKVGKSFGAALWGAGLGIIPGRRISLIGQEYDICEPEFSYIAEFLLSERGMGMKKTSYVNRPRQGDMFLELENGTRYEARSWERKDSLKGKEIDAYIYCEAYQLPGIECFTGFSQNLRVRKGYGIFATTPDRPWVKELHKLGHGADSEWECVCDIDAEVNPYSFDAKAKERDRTLMTREKYAIHYEGKLGDFVGRVFAYSRGSNQFSAGTHPELFQDGQTRPESLHIPEGWEIVGGIDTGTYYTGVVVAFSPQGDAFVLDEFPNYRYVGGLADRDEGVTIPDWAGRIRARTESLGGRAAYWADANSQFKGELRNYGVTILPDKARREQRTEIAREYFQHGRVFLAPWLEVLPFEIENACWPEEASLSGRFERVKDRDHTLDCVEHVLGKRPKGVWRTPKPAGLTWAESEGLKKFNRTGNQHLGCL